MHHLLHRLLRKRGVEIDQLEGQEKSQVDNWNRVLTGSDITVEKIKEFCENQVRLIEGKWRDLDNSEKKNERLITQHSVYKAILALLDAPSKEIENLEKYLVDLIEK